jgi:5-formyltetrahydrofolate cyclo-ligase
VTGSRYRGSVNPDQAAQAKQAVRERVWRLLERKKVVRFPGARGRIPNFTDAEAAAGRLTEVTEWVQAAVLKANPDAPQLPVRAAALDQGKVVYMAVPRLREERPFILLDPSRLRGPARPAASIRGAGRYGRRIPLGRVRRIDLVVCGSVAVNRRGVRVGKGGGFSDLEFALLAERGLIDDETSIVTTVHPLQILDEDLPETVHDFRVDRIVTADGVLRCRRVRRPSGVLWSHLDGEKVRQVPALASLARAGRRPVSHPSNRGRMGPERREGA